MILFAKLLDIESGECIVHLLLQLLLIGTEHDVQALVPEDLRIELQLFGVELVIVISELVENITVDHGQIEPVALQFPQV